jgi:hypothetical protein
MLKIGISLASKICLLNTSQVLFNRISHFGYSLKKGLTHVFGGIFSNQAYASLFSIFHFLHLLVPPCYYTCCSTSPQLTLQGVVFSMPRSYFSVSRNHFHDTRDSTSTTAMAIGKIQSFGSMPTTVSSCPPKFSLDVAAI